MTRPLRVGDILDGTCGGAFGRDAYRPKRVEAIGSDWVVARDEYDGPVIATGDPDDLTRYVITEEDARAR